jgi:hypothetical protein
MLCLVMVFLRLTCTIVVLELGNFFHLVFAISGPVSSFCCWHKHMSPVDISLLMKLAVLKLVLKTKQILLPLQLWRSTSAWTQSCGMSVPARLFPCPRWVARLCTSLRATASRLVHKLTMLVNIIYVLFQFGCQAQTPNLSSASIFKARKILPFLH